MAEERNCTERDEFFWLSQINKATLVINTDEGLCPKEEAPKFARAISDVIREGNEPGGERPPKVIKYEPLLIAKAGPEITILHAGRSSQDMHSTFRIAMVRDHVAEVMRAADDAAEALTAMALEHKATLLPNYTNGVAAQPNTLGHYLLGMLEGFNRDRERLTELARRLDHCPMGSTVLNGTSWPLNRRRMASCLGFSDITSNCFDGTLVINVDIPVEFAQICESLALHVATIIQDVSVQYAQPSPWIILQEGGENTYVSSAMPQKRNPGIMIQTRGLASQAIADASAILIRAHNIIPGMVDAKTQSAAKRASESTVKMLSHFTRVVKAFRVNPERALEELNSDWTASQEIADTLMREYRVPFRVGHHVASKMVGWARANNVLPLDFPYEKMQEIFREVTRDEWHEMELPFSKEEFREILNPRAIVNRRAVEGGPQPEEMERQLARQQELNRNFEAWRAGLVRKVDGALAKLDEDFRKFL